MSLRAESSAAQGIWESKKLLGDFVNKTPQKISDLTHVPR
jgi:hypothetical protein